MTRLASAARAWRELAGETMRYGAAGTVALLADFATYVLLIRVAGVNYLVAAPLGFAVGLVIIYAFSVRWVFLHRRLGNPSAEFTVFAGIGLAGMAVNEIVIYAGVEHVALSYESAKLASAALVFGFNFGLRKLLLFTRR